MIPLIMRNEAYSTAAATCEHAQYEKITLATGEWIGIICRICKREEIAPEWIVYGVGIELRYA